MIEMKNDGLTRLTYKDLEKIDFNHLYSELNQDKTTTKSVIGSQTILSGLTEWASNTTPVLSISWDWKFDPFIIPPDYRLDGLPFSNIMIVSEKGQDDIGELATLKTLALHISKFNWSESVKNYLNRKYA